MGRGSLLSGLEVFGECSPERTGRVHNVFVDRVRDARVFSRRSRSSCLAASRAPSQLLNVAPMAAPTTPTTATTIVSISSLPGSVFWPDLQGALHPLRVR